MSYVKKIVDRLVVCCLCLVSFMGPGASQERTNYTPQEVNQHMRSSIKVLQDILPAISYKAGGCDSDICQEPVCRGEFEIYRDLLSLRFVLDRYIQTLNAEDAALRRAVDDAITNADRSAARLEANRISARMTHTTDQFLGAVVEMNGLANTFTSGSKSPVSIWETVKDVNSLINRVYDAQTGLGNQVESIRYNPELASGQGLGFNVKAIEDAYIDIFSVGPKAASELIPRWLSETIQSGVPDQDLTQFSKDNTSNAVDIYGGVTGALNDLKKLRQEGATLKDLRAARDKYRSIASKNLGKGALADFDKQMEQAEENFGTSRRDAAGMVAFAAVQVIARAVQKYYSEEKLKAFRATVAELRQEANGSGDPHFGMIEDRDKLRRHRNEVETLARQLHLAAQSIRSCAFANCQDRFDSLSVIDLPQVRTRSDGRLAFAAEQKALAPLLGALAQSLAQNLAAAGGVAPVLPKGTNSLSVSFGPTLGTSPCPDCAPYFTQARAESWEYDTVLWQIGGLEPDRDSAAMVRQRQLTLFEAQEYQNSYNSFTASKGERWFGNLTDEDMHHLTDLAAKIRQETAKANALGQEIRRIRALETMIRELGRDLEALDTAKRRSEDRALACGKAVCKSGQDIDRFNALSGEDQICRPREPRCDPSNLLNASADRDADRSCSYWGVGGFGILALERKGDQVFLEWVKTFDAPSKDLMNWHSYASSANDAYWNRFEFTPGPFFSGRVRTKPRPDGPWSADNYLSTGMMSGPLLHWCGFPETAPDLYAIDARLRPAFLRIEDTPPPIVAKARATLELWFNPGHAMTRQTVYSATRKEPNPSTKRARGIPQCVTPFSPTRVSYDGFGEQYDFHHGAHPGRRRLIGHRLSPGTDIDALTLTSLPGAISDESLAAPFNAVRALMIKNPAEAAMSYSIAQKERSIEAALGAQTHVRFAAPDGSPDVLDKMVADISETRVHIDQLKAEMKRIGDTGSDVPKARPNAPVRFEKQEIPDIPQLEPSFAPPVPTFPTFTPSVRDE